MLQSWLGMFQCVVTGVFPAQNKSFLKARFDLICTSMFFCCFCWFLLQFPACLCGFNAPAWLTLNDNLFAPTINQSQLWCPMVSSAAVFAWQVAAAGTSAISACTGHSCWISSDSTTWFKQHQCIIKRHQHSTAALCFLPYFQWFVNGCSVSLRNNFFCLYFGSRQSPGIQ